MTTERHGLDASGLFDERYHTFLESVSHLRAGLHRYCARMTGSVLDGEDVMQEVLFEAYPKLGTLADMDSLRPWLFRIAHNRCIDFLRKRDVRQSAEAAFVVPDVVLPIDPPGAALGRAVERLVLHLPPKERACVLLKDVFDDSLEEIADLVDSTVGGVKAALNRGRSKLAALADTPKVFQAPRDPELSKLLHLYVERFNQRDWEGVRELTRADARLRVSDCFAGRLVDSPYFIEYERGSVPWKMELGEIDGEAVVIVLARVDDGWVPGTVVRIGTTGDRITRISDYRSCPWIADAAHSFSVLFYPPWRKHNVPH